jgi:hypothetical protein
MKESYSHLIYVWEDTVHYSCITKRYGALICYDVLVDVLGSSYFSLYFRVGCFAIAE